jgi:hypothetical protein
MKYQPAAATTAATRTIHQYCARPPSARIRAVTEGEPPVVEGTVVTVFAIADVILRTMNVINGMTGLIEVSCVR